MRRDPAALNCYLECYIRLYSTTTSFAIRSRVSALLPSGPSLRKTTLVKLRQTFDRCIAQFGHCAEKVSETTILCVKGKLLGVPRTFPFTRISEIVLSVQERIVTRYTMIL